MKVLFYYDVVCPYAYLASTRIEALAARRGFALELRPMLLGGVFRAIAAPQVPAAHLPPEKAALNLADMQRWAALYGVPLQLPAGHPRRTVEAMRLCHTVDGAERARLMHALYRAYFVEGRDVADRAVLADLAGSERVRQIDAPEVKDALRRTTDEAIADGVFGAPAFVVLGDDGTRKLYWGQDRLLFLGDEPPAPAPSDVGPRELTFYYDFSSPFSYLGATQVERVAAAHGARVRWRPFLLGALFKQIGTPEVPLLAASEPKRRYYLQDLQDWAAHWGVDFRWPSRFPMRSVAALRLALAVDEAARPALSLRLYRAYWVEDRDLADPDVLRAVGAEAGVEAAAVERALAPDPAVKQALVDSTAEARAAGVCGAPSFVVGGYLFWGQDRLPLVDRVLGGWRPPA
jgi:2-hydroxychromene-2-carboxylate isomerase